MTIVSLHQMSLAEAEAALTSIGYDPKWSVPELIAAIPLDMLDRIELALRITAAAAQAEASALEAEVARRHA